MSILLQEMIGVELNLFSRNTLLLMYGIVLGPFSIGISLTHAVVHYQCTTESMHLPTGKGSCIADLKNKISSSEVAGSAGKTSPAPDKPEEQRALSLTETLHHLPEPADERSRGVYPLAGGDRLEELRGDFTTPAHHGLQLGPREEREEGKGNDAGHTFSECQRLLVTLVESHVEGQFEVFLMVF